MRRKVDVDKGLCQKLRSMGFRCCMIFGPLLQVDCEKLCISLYTKKLTPNRLWCSHPTAWRKPTMTVAEVTTITNPSHTNCPSSSLWGRSTAEHAHTEWKAERTRPIHYVSHLPRITCLSDGTTRLLMFPTRWRSNSVSRIRSPDLGILRMIRWEIWYMLDYILHLFYVSIASEVLFHPCLTHSRYRRPNVTHCYLCSTNDCPWLRYRVFSVGNNPRLSSMSNSKL